MGSRRRRSGVGRGAKGRAEEKDGKHEDEGDQNKSRGTAVERHFAKRASTPRPEGAIHVPETQNKKRNEEATIMAWEKGRKVCLLETEEAAADVPAEACRRRISFGSQSARKGRLCWFPCETVRGENAASSVRCTVPRCSRLTRDTTNERSRGDKRAHRNGKAQFGTLPPRTQVAAGLSLCRAASSPVRGSQAPDTNKAVSPTAYAGR